MVLGSPQLLLEGYHLRQNLGLGNPYPTTPSDLKSVMNFDVKYKNQF